MMMGGLIRRGTACLPLLAGAALGCRSEPARSPDNAAAAQAGSSPEHPALRCGPEDSYAYVAREFRCPDGTNPFGGDLRGAARARSGSRRGGGGHHIDSYEVPCASGAVTVFVDMYACDEQPLPEEQLSAGARKLMGDFEAGSFEELMGRCSELRSSPGGPPTELVVCAMTVPVVLLALGENEGDVEVERTCAGLPAPSEKSDARQAYLGLVFAALDFQGGLPDSRLSKDQVNGAKERFGAACGVHPSSVPRVDLRELF